MMKDLYKEIVLDHFRRPRNKGELEGADVEQRVFNPLCGDEVVVTFDADGGCLTDVKVAGQGCSISQSSASMMSAAVKGRSVDEARSLVRAFKALMTIHESRLGREGGDGSGTDTPVPDPDVALGDLEALQGVVRFPVRIKCATLPWNTLTNALDEVEAKAS
jgi:nitrogen fixation NifU-like protein